MIGSLYGMRIIEDPSLVDHDFSGCRSPSRAARRFFKRGIRGRVVTKPKMVALSHVQQGIMIMHPAMAAEVRRRLPSSTPPGYSIPR